MTLMVNFLPTYRTKDTTSILPFKNFPNLDGNLPIVLAYGVYISQLIAGLSF
jgi:hypothetical protein